MLPTDSSQAFWAINFEKAESVKVKPIINEVKLPVDSNQSFWIDKKSSEWRTIDNLCDAHHYPVYKL